MGVRPNREPPQKDVQVRESEEAVPTRVDPKISATPVYESGVSLG